MDSKPTIDAHFHVVIVEINNATDHTIRRKVPPIRAVSAPPVRSEVPRFFLPEILVLSSVPVRSVLRISIVVHLECNIYSHSEYIVPHPKYSKHRQVELNSRC